MTPRERLLTVLNGEIPDRVPVSFFVQEEYLSWYYPQRQKIRRLEEAVDCARELDFDIMVRGKEFEIPHFMKRSFVNWELNRYEKVENDKLYAIFEIKTPGGILKQVEAGSNLKRGGGGIHRSTVEYLIKDENDFEIFSRYAPPVDAKTVDEMRRYAEYARERIGDTGICVPWGWAGVCNQAANYRNVQEIMMDAYLNPDFYEAYMKKITQMEVEFNSILAQFPIDAVGIQGNIANSSMVGRDFFEAYIFPYEKELVDAVKSKNKHTVYHNCGKAKILIDITICTGAISIIAKTAAALVKPFVDSYDYKPTNYLAADETYTKVKGIRLYIWFVMDAIKKSILGYQISETRDVGPCILALRMAFSKFKEFPGKALKFVADGYTAYKFAQQQFALQDMDFNLIQVIGHTNDDPVSTEYRWLKQIIERLPLC